MQLTPHGFSEPNKEAGPSSSLVRFVELANLTGQKHALALITCVSGVCLLPYHIWIPITPSARIAPTRVPPCPLGLVHTWAVRGSCRGSIQPHFNADESGGE